MSTEPQTPSGRTALTFLSPDYARLPAWEKSILAIEAEAADAALDALEAAVAGLPDSFGIYPVEKLVTSAAVLDAIATARKETK